MPSLTYEAADPLDVALWYDRADYNCIFNGHSKKDKNRVMMPAPPIPIIAPRKPAGIEIRSMVGISIAIVILSSLLRLYDSSFSLWIY